MNHLSLIMLVLFSKVALNSSKQTQNNACNLWKEKHVINIKERLYFNFSSTRVKFENFEELKKLCEKIEIPNNLLNLFAEKDKKIINNDIDLRDFIKMLVFNLESKKKYIIFHNIQGFNQNFANLSVYHLNSFSIEFH